MATDTLDVLAGESLLIEAGVEVLFDGPWPLLVHGTLEAVGAEGDSITFAPLASGATWQGIRFFDAGPGSALRYCRLRSAHLYGNTPESACGAAIFSSNSSPLIASCSIADCTIDLTAYLDGHGGGGVFCRGGSPLILDNRIVDCHANASCGGGGGGICVLESDATITGNTIRGCTAHGGGGGIGAYRSQVEITHNMILQCSGFHTGGGMELLYDCTGRVYDNAIVENACEDSPGGGLCIGSNEDIEVAFCTIAHNMAGSGQYGNGGGIGASSTGGSPIIRDCIVWGNEAGSNEQIYYWGDSTLPVSYCDVQDGFPGAGNFSADPVFTGGSGAAGYFLAGSFSPCVDAGDCTAAEAGLDRRTTRPDLLPDSGTADLGYHYAIPGMTGVASSAPTRPRVRIFAAPNPFRTQTTIRIVDPNETWASARIYDSTGRLVEVIRPGDGSGTAWIRWDGRNTGGRLVAPGTYFYRVDGRNGNRLGTGKLTLSR